MKATSKPLLCWILYRSRKTARQGRKPFTPCAGAGQITAR